MEIIIEIDTSGVQAALAEMGQRFTAPRLQVLLNRIAGAYMRATRARITQGLTGPGLSRWTMAVKGTTKPFQSWAKQGRMIAGADSPTGRATAQSKFSMLQPTDREAGPYPPNVLELHEQGYTIQPTGRVQRILLQKNLVTLRKARGKQPEKVFFRSTKPRHVPARRVLPSGDEGESIIAAAVADWLAQEDAKVARSRAKAIARGSFGATR